MASAMVWMALAPSTLAGPTVNVTVSSSEDILGIGQTRTFSVLASVANPAGNLDGIFSYDINVNVSAAGVLQIVPGSIVQSGSDVIVNPGVITPTGLSACYGVYFNTQNFGIASPKELVRFSLEGLSTGSATVTVTPDATIGDDFLLQKSSAVLVNYSAATALMTVAHMPDPSTVQIRSGETLGLGDANIVTSTQTIENAGLLDITAGEHAVTQVIGLDANLLQGITRVAAGATLTVGQIVQDQVFVSGTLILDGSLLAPASPTGVMGAADAATDAGTSVPEPATLLLLALGGLTLIRRRRRPPVRTCRRGSASPDA